MTALFCDLVGFTSLSEAADPEDVDRMLADYFALARREIERHGGTVEKFIGDAVVGIFGAPATHEDDPERAVRAALRIAAGANGLRTAGGAPLRLRVGINTGETFVHVGATAASGDALVVGDAINTASRIQSVAPEMGVAVGLSTWESTHLAIDYEELPPATLKGKAEPVRVFHARGVRTSLGVDLSRSHAGGYVGREVEIGRLRGAFDEAVVNHRTKFVAIVGEPGIGKSRIVAELAARVRDASPEVVWRQGRCLPYGDGVTFWALGEILKAHAGILEDDDAATASARIDDVLPETADRGWLRERLLPLVGAGAAGGDREEQFGAWRAFVAGIAATRPAVIVFEDIHWADEALLAFLGSLAANPPEAPLLVLMTSRPTIDELHPDFTADLPGIDRLDLAALTDEETRRLIVGLLGAVVPAELHGPIIDRAQGNPLYAEEFVRLLVDRDLLVRSDGRYELRVGATIPMPDSITSLLAARLDTLPPARKSLLADAAVIGKVFWSGAVAAMEGRTPDDVDAELAELARIELIRPAERSSMAGEAEYAFWHVLARDVAYQQLPRPSRAARHQAAADWLEAKAGGRVEDVAQVLAHHYATALDLARAAGDPDRARALEPCALRYLRMAGERAIGLDTAAAVSFLEQALALAPANDPERPQILAAFAVAADQAARHEDAATAFEEAIAAFEAQGDRRAAARAMLRLHLVYVSMRDPRAPDLTPRALESLTSVEPSVDLVMALTQRGVESTAVGDTDGALADFDRALAIAAEIGIPPPARTLRRRGHLRLRIGDRDGLADCERAIQAARAAGDAREAAIGSLWYAGQISGIEGYGRALPILTDGLDHALTRGLSSMVQLLESAVALFDVDAGLFDDAVSTARHTLADARASGAHAIVAECLYTLLSVLSLRGTQDELPALLDELTALNPKYGVDDLWPDLQAVMAEANLALGRRDEAAGVIRRVLAEPDAKLTGYVYLVGRFVRVATELGLSETDAMLDGVNSLYPIDLVARRWAEALIAESRGDLAGAVAAYEEATDGYRALEARPWEAITRLGHGRSLASLGRHDEAHEALRAARAIFEDLRATPWITECDSALGVT